MERLLKIAPNRLLVLGFLVIIFTGAVALYAPVSNVGGISFVDAVYTSTSATCVTGLIVKNTPVDFTPLGKIIILFLIQIGGLGYMAIGTFIAVLVGRRVGLTGQILLRDSLNLESLEGIMRFLKGLVIFVFTMEFLGAFALTVRFLGEYSFIQSVSKGIFHSVSAFNNAGFSLFPDNLMRYRGDLTVNLVIMLLIIMGGIGFIVVSDVYSRITGSNTRIMSHTKIVIATTALLIVFGAISIYLFEREFLFSRSEFGILDTVLTSLFASVSPRTAGYNTIDYSWLQSGTLLTTMLLMFIGASPGGTGGGVKTSTFAVVMAHIFCNLKGKMDTALFKRRVPVSVVSRAFLIITLSLLFIIAITIAVVSVEHTDFQKTLFEVISAFGTVGLSVGNGDVLSLSANFSDFSKIMIIITMFAGRLGPLTLFYALLKQKEEKVHYPEGRIFVG